MSATIPAFGRSHIDLPVLGLALAGLGWPAIELGQEGAWASVGLLAMAAALGWVFLHESFGYTGAFRAWLVRRDGSALAAGLLVALVAALVVIPVTALVPGYTNFTAPLGLPLIGGAALLGVGKQLGNG